MTCARETAFQMKRAIARTNCLNTCGLMIRRASKGSKLIWRNYLTSEEAIIAIVSTTDDLMAAATAALRVVKTEREKESRDTQEAA
jgi:hypothetical protein